MMLILPWVRFTRQWPEMRHVFQCSSLALLLDSAAYLASEKLDGSNLAVTSRGVVASRRTVLLNRQAYGLHNMGTTASAIPQYMFIAMW